jgi:organic hydroperoxide reductase OsmC/OhrA
MNEETQVTIKLKHLEGYNFNVNFDWEDAADILMDEGTPLGNQTGPNATRLLAAATANCLSASLLFCVNKTDVTPGSLSAEASCTLVRNEKGRLRIGGIQVRITIADELTNSARIQRCQELFEDFCVVTSSLRQGIPVNVKIFNSAGKLLYDHG